jgi:hypothetical protein
MDNIYTNINLFFETALIMRCLDKLFVKLILIKNFPVNKEVFDQYVRLSAI